MILLLFQLDFLDQIVCYVKSDELPLSKLSKVGNHLLSSSEEDIWKLTLFKRKRFQPSFVVLMIKLLNDLSDISFFIPKFLIVVVELVVADVEGLTSELHQ